jgi:molybdopterin-guanine dinucleotide biosynthesis protein A
MIPTACGILAGGASSRMGRNKALLPFRGRPLLRHQLEILQPLFSEILISANDAGPYSPFKLRVVPDLLAERSSLAGVHALLKAATAPRVFVVACDLPFLNRDLILKLLSIPGDFDVILPETGAGVEPLHAIYSRTCLPAIEREAADGHWKMTGFHRGLWIDTVPINDDDWLVEGRSPFTNANTPEEWSDTAP